jgi:hypothetical protein
MAAFGLLYFNVLNIEWIHIDKPMPSVYATVGYSSVNIEHEGGNQVNRYSLFKNGVLFRNGSNWMIGDRINVPVVNGDNLLMLGDDEVLVILDDILLPVPIPGPEPPATNETLFETSLGTTYTTWIRVGTSPYINLLDSTNYIECNSENQKIGWFGFSNVSIEGTSFLLNISAYCKNSGNNGRAYFYVDYTGGTGTLFGPVGQHTAWQYDVINLGTHTRAEVNNIRIYIYGATSTGYPVEIDYANIGVKVV